MSEKGERTWVAYSDWLAIAATTLSLLLVLLPAVIRSVAVPSRLQAGAAGPAVVLLVSWLPAILAHYRLILGGNRAGLRRTNPEPPEKLIVLVAGTAATATLLTLLVWP